MPALAKLGNAFSIAANLPGLEKSFRSVSWDWGSGTMDFVEMNSPPSVWLPWPTTSFYSLGSYSLCLPLQSLLHKIPKEEVAFHSLPKHKDWQEKEAQRARGRVLVPTQGIHTAIFFLKTKTTAKWKMLTTWLGIVHHRGWEWKHWKSRDIWSNRQIWTCTKWSRAKANRVLSREHTGHSKHSLPTTQETVYTWTSPDGQ